MKYSIAAIVVTLVAFPTLHAESPIAREFKQLRDQRDKAVAAALEPINRRYQASLEQLLRRATQGNDLDTALKLKEEMTLPTLTASEADQSRKHSLKDFTTVEGFGQWLVGTEWKKDDKDSFRFVTADKLEFEILSSNKKLEYSYRILATGEIAYADEKYKLTIDHTLKKMTHSSWGDYVFVRPKPKKN